MNKQAQLIAVCLCVAAASAYAEPPKRHQSLWDFIRAYHAAVQTDDEERTVQEAPKVKPAEPPRWGWERKPKPQPCGCYAGGEAVNYPPYDVQP